MNTFELDIPDLVRWYRKTSDDGLRITNDSVKNALFYCAEDDLQNTKQQLIHIGLVVQKMNTIMEYIHDYHNKNIITKDIVDYVSNNFEKVINNSKICMHMINRCNENINNINM
jgi:flagellar biosynthesis component FlhA